MRPSGRSQTIAFRACSPESYGCALRREVERDHPLFAPGTPCSHERDLARLSTNRRWRDPYELPRARRPCSAR